ncbi:Isochorismatase domain-containing protein [Favolaschia claudopus]|uniref:nicotinamidase n=1 Tax=Favolaschia claudopus TaxID=2862362 RepID=A0AAV9ZD75_9AGAR
MHTKAALIIVDLQEDFCPPVQLASCDHISFAANHPPPNNKPFESYAEVINPYNPSERYETRLWPVHCIQGSPGAELVPELDVSKVDKIIEKGQDKRVEMYSAFKDPFENPCVSESALRGYLKDNGVGKVYVLGLAMDFCVSATAKHAVKDGFQTYIVEDGTKAVDPGEGWAKARAEMESLGVKFIRSEEILSQKE